MRSGSHSAAPRPQQRCIEDGQDHPLYYTDEFRLFCFKVSGFFCAVRARGTRAGSSTLPRDPFWRAPPVRMGWSHEDARGRVFPQSLCLAALLEKFHCYQCWRTCPCRWLSLQRKQPCPINPAHCEREPRVPHPQVLPCSKRYCHDWTKCPFAHQGEKARRRWDVRGQKGPMAGGSGGRNVARVSSVHELPCWRLRRALQGGTGLGETCRSLCTAGHQYCIVLQRWSSAHWVPLYHWGRNPNLFHHLVPYAALPAPLRARHHRDVRTHSYSPVECPDMKKVRHLFAHQILGALPITPYS